MEILRDVKTALDCCDPTLKVKLSRELLENWNSNKAAPLDYPLPKDEPGRPEYPALVPPSEVPRRRLGSEKGRAAMMHAVAHIEFNAINLALDMISRFAGHPELENTDDKIAFISDWLSVAADEARHFSMINTYLNSQGYEYGTFPAHNGLWDAALDTSQDIAARLAIAPMVLEARGLDVTPQIIEKLRKNNDPEAITILKVILEEEVQHVYFGTKWFNFIAQKRSKAPTAYFHELVRTHFKGLLKEPFNKKARFAAELYEDYYLPLS